MPTIIALDVSLSMVRRVLMPDCAEDYQRRHLAIHGINTLIDYITSHCRLEFVSVVLFSSLYEVYVPFTRDFDSIKTKLQAVEQYNKTCIETALNGIASTFTETWGPSATGTLAQVVLVTDGNSGCGPGSLQTSLQTMAYRDPANREERFPLPFTFSAKLNIMCIANPNDPDLQHSLPLYQKLIDINRNGGEVHTLETSLSFKSVEFMFRTFAEKTYTPFHGLLRCGNLKCSVTLFPPPPRPYRREHDFHMYERTVQSTLDICGFLDITDIVSPPIVSRHLVLPAPAKDKNKHSAENGDTDKEKKDENEISEEDSKSAAFTVLLHGSLKIEGMVALTQIGEDWYGMLHSWADSKKKSNLMISIFEPGADAVNWLGNLNYLMPSGEFPESPYGADDNKTPFPIKPTDKRSYAQSCIMWIHQQGLQSDLQKILRHAKKLPDKQAQFYKELNRLRRAALSFGFLELLDALAGMLERECRILPGNTHPDAALQLTHAASVLRSEKAKDIAHMIVPLRTNFATDDQ